MSTASSEPSARSARATTNSRRFAFRGRRVPVRDPTLLLPVVRRLSRRWLQDSHFTLRILAERVRFELTGLAPSGFQV